MKKAEVVTNLRQHVSRGKFLLRGEQTFAMYFAGWLTVLEMPHDKEFDHYDIVPYLPQLAVDAWEEMRTGEGQIEADYREAFQKETESEMVDLINHDLGTSVILQCTGMAVLKAVIHAGTRLEEVHTRYQVEQYCTAQSTAIQAIFDRFLRLVYRKGLYQLINDSSSRGMSGRFGSTELRTWVCAGRIMFTFARPKKKGAELSVSFVGDDSDPLGLAAGIQSVEARLPTAILMIEDVIVRWPKSTADQLRIFRASNVTAFPGLG